MRNIYDLIDQKQAYKLKNILKNNYHNIHNNQRLIIELAFLKTNTDQEIKKLNITDAEIELVCKR